MFSWIRMIKDRALRVTNKVRNKENYQGIMINQLASEESKPTLVMSKVPNAPDGTPEAVAQEILDNVLNLILNRHIHVLEDNGYLKIRKYRKAYGWNHDEPRNALILKWRLMDEAKLRFTEYVSEKIDSYHRAKLDPKDDTRTQN